MYSGKPNATLSFLDIIILAEPGTLLNFKKQKVYCCAIFIWFLALQLFFRFKFLFKK